MLKRILVSILISIMLVHITHPAAAAAASESKVLDETRDDALVAQAKILIDRYKPNLINCKPAINEAINKCPVVEGFLKIPEGSDSLLKTIDGTLACMYAGLKHVAVWDLPHRPLTPEEMAVSQLKKLKYIKAALPYDPALYKYGIGQKIFIVFYTPDKENDAELLMKILCLHHADYRYVAMMKDGGAYKPNQKLFYLIGELLGYSESDIYAQYSADRITDVFAQAKEIATVVEANNTAAELEKWFSENKEKYRIKMGDLKDLDMKPIIEEEEGRKKRYDEYLAEQAVTNAAV